MENSIRIHVPVEKIRAFCLKWGVKEFSLFGSVLTDHFDADSDVDVMLEFLPDHGFTFENTPVIEDELREMFNRAIDVVEKKLIRNPFRRASILASHLVVYAA